MRLMKLFRLHFDRGLVVTKLTINTWPALINVVLWSCSFSDKISLIQITNTSLVRLGLLGPFEAVAPGAVQG